MGRAERALGACIALTLTVGLGVVVVDDGHGRTTHSNAAAARRSPASLAAGRVAVAPPAADVEVGAAEPSSGSTGRTSRRTSSTAAGGAAGSTPLPLDGFGPPTTAEPAPAPPPSDDLADELIGGVLDLVPVDSGTCGEVPPAGSCDQTSG